jgi:hypothetical protein
MNIVKITDKVWQYKNVHENIDAILEKTLENNWWPYSNDFNPDGSECESLIKGSAMRLQPEHDSYKEILNIFIKCFDNYITENSLDFSVENIDINLVENRDWLEQKHVLLRKYTAGSRMSAHEDGGESIFPSYTGLLYFNGNFEGGELNFPNDNICISPEKSSLVIFPSNMSHEVLLLVSGERYATSAYLYKTPKD